MNFKSLFFILALLMIFSCTPKRKKPFIIISKSPNMTRGGELYFNYIYQDSIGNSENFEDVDKFNVGDTLK